MDREDLLDSLIVDQMASLMAGPAGVDFRKTLASATDRLLTDLERDGQSRETLSFALHSLRGMCANVGLRAVSERAGVLQLAALDGRLPANAAAELRCLVGVSLDAFEGRLGASSNAATPSDVNSFGGGASVGNSCGAAA